MADTKRIRRTVDSPIRYAGQDIALGDEIDVPAGVADELVVDGWELVQTSANDEAPSSDSLTSDSPTPSRRKRGSN